MQTQPQSSGKRKLFSANYWRYSSIQFFHCFSQASSGYLTVFLQSIGMNASQVGLIGALNSAVGIASGPFWGMLSDKMRSVRKVLLVALILAAITWACVPVSSGFSLGAMNLVMLVVPISAFFRLPHNSLVDSWMVQNANRQRLNYGAIRLWGSIGYGVMSLILSALMPVIGVRTTFSLYGITMIPLLLLCFFSRDDAVKEKSLSLREMQIGRLFKNYYFVTYLVFAVALNMPVNTIGAFLPYLMEETQVSTDLFGVITGYRALLEIPTLMIMARLRRRFSLPKIMLAAAALYVIESYCYSFINGFGPLLAVQTMHGLAGGIFLGCGSNYVYSLAPNELKATAQTVTGSVNSLAGIVGNLLGGYLLDTMGVRSFYVAAGTFVLIAALFFIATLLLGKRISREPSPLNVTLNH